MISKAVITGGAGFVGSQLGYSLATAGVAVTLLDNMSFGYLDNLVMNGRPIGPLVVRDVRDGDLCSVMEDADIVFHLAGISALPVCQSQPYLAWAVNAAGTANVLEAARVSRVKKVIFSSTSAVYERSGQGTHSELINVAPDLVYGSTKLAAEGICSSFSRNYGMDISVCRFFNVYGPHQDLFRASPPFTSYVARELAAGRTPTLYNRSSARRDYIHVEDVIRILTAMAHSPKSYQAEVFNVGSGEGYTVAELYEMLRRISGKDLQPHYQVPTSFWDRYENLFAGPNPLNRARIQEEVYKDSVADITKVTKEFGWRPLVGIEEGLGSVYAYAVQHCGQ